MKKFLIINADDFGMCHSMNKAIMDLFDMDLISSASLMITCPWVIEAVDFCKYKKVDIGLHPTFTSEWKNYKWGPVVKGKVKLSITDTYGHFLKRWRNWKRGLRKAI